MNVEIKELIESDPRRRQVLKAVLEHPYLERQALQQGTQISSQDLDSVLSALIDALVLLELASQADSSVESRVPKKVYLVNPDLEQAIRQLV